MCVEFKKFTSTRPLWLLLTILCYMVLLLFNLMNYFSYDLFLEWQVWWGKIWDFPADVYLWTCICNMFIICTCLFSLEWSSMYKTVLFIALLIAWGFIFLELAVVMSEGDIQDTPLCGDGFSSRFIYAKPCTHNHHCRFTNFWIVWNFESSDC